MTVNDSEFVNKPVAKMLDKLFIEFTRSRRHSNDNRLAATKNGAAVRKIGAGGDRAALRHPLGKPNVEHRSAGEVEDAEHRPHTGPPRPRRPRTASGNEGTAWGYRAVAHCSIRAAACNSAIRSAENP